MTRVEEVGENLGLTKFGKILLICMRDTRVRVTGHRWRNSDCTYYSR